MIRELAVRGAPQTPPGARHLRHVGGLAAAAAVALMFRTPSAPVMVAHSQPAASVLISKPERRHLPDGSVVDLDRDGAIEDRRGIHLRPPWHPAAARCGPF